MTLFRSINMLYLIADAEIQLSLQHNLNRFQTDSKKVEINYYDVLYTMTQQ